MEYGKIDKLFKANEVTAFQFVKSFAKEYGAMPTPETIEAHTGEKLVPHKEVSGYYYDLMDVRHVEIELKRAMKEVSDLLLPDNKDPEAALKAVVEAAMGLVATKYRKNLVDFRHCYEMIIADYAKKSLAGDEHGLQFGWPTLDKATGGLVKTDLISFVGRPGRGKTWQMLYGAHHGWKKAGAKTDPEFDQSRLFVSMEMSVLAIQQRLAAMQAHLPASNLKHGALITKSFKKLKHDLIEIQGYGAPFYVVDGNLTATVDDICMMAHQLKPAAIFIDGAYLLQHPYERDRFRRVAENCDLIKKQLAPIAPTVCSWQFAKSAAKKNLKKGEKPELEDIGNTDAIAQHSSLVLGLFEEDTVETLQCRNVRILKGRSGETGEFRTRWNFGIMDFTEIEKASVSDLQFM